MSRPTPRKPASSRGQTPRPRRIAGQAARPAGDERPDEQPDEPFDEPVDDPLDEPVQDDAAEEDRPGLLARPRTTRVLIAVLALVTIALVAEFVLLAVDRFGDDEDPVPPAEGSSSLTVPRGRPVVAPALQWRDGVEAAAKAAQELVSVDYAKYDEEVARAVELTTERYEKDYLKTIGDVKEQGVAQKLVVKASVVAQGVVRANRTRLEALVFLNQVVERERDGEKETVVTPYRVLVTMVHTDHGWLVDRLDTDDPSASVQKDEAEQDKTN
ncbi:hypothetical protein ACJ5H2_11520 [Nocardioides sp. R1-1]|uniref:hypothetical protein n=1 Tax=Nocardioides sp. R1-1 TaxID=3383502 RepID=UPI0038D1B29F